MKTPKATKKEKLTFIFLIMSSIGLLSFYLGLRFIYFIAPYFFIVKTIALIMGVTDGIFAYLIYRKVKKRNLQIKSRSEKIPSIY